MDTGVAIFPTHDAISPAEMARLAEERGHESLFFPEHTHIPASRESAWPGGSDLPRRYAHTFDSGQITLIVWPSGKHASLMSTTLF
jgi:alkanesulfonate monooxygenase SsuD/methylene tetrahydromethanopterin reductase-like flavin-dependent oxidoreductase (luciferase family)